jgi:DNA-binding response OmpR family regulator
VCSSDLLIADDEPGVVSLLKDYFEMNDYLVFTAGSGEETIKKTEREPDIILLDINMPNINGIEVCKKIREHISCPIIFLTARVDEPDKIIGFSAGADDYVTKPFSIDELGARVAAHLRRENRRFGNTKIRFEDDLTIDYSAHKVTFRETEIQFAKKEFEIIELLTEYRGQVFDKERIYECLWDYDAEGDSSVIAEHIKRIRAKMSAAGAKNHIETVWGVGYKWR